QEVPKPPIICIEEPENFLHPAALEKLLAFLQDVAHKWPILLTTHSPYLVNGVRPQDIIVAVVDDTGSTHFEKPRNRKAITERLNRGYMNFGDLLVTNFRDMLK
ncbi:MAG: AAA family ATPase, partial [Planctomycetota bacterium]|nr:AAA family ATPase [Planctomycetota bacterium]